MEDDHISDMFQLDSIVDIDAIYSKGSRDSDGYDCILVYIHKPKTVRPLKFDHASFDESAG